MKTEMTYLEMTDNEKVLYLEGFTELYKGFSDNEFIARELAILGLQVPAIFQLPQKGDLITGRMKYPPLVFTPQALAAHGGYGYVFDRSKFNKLRDSPVLSSLELERLHAIAKFWTVNDTSVRTRAAYPKELKTWLHSDNWTGEPGIAFPLYRMAGSQPDYGKLLKYGISGLKKLVAEKMSILSGKDIQSTEFYLGLTGALDILSELCLFYSEKVGEMLSDAVSHEYDDILGLKKALQNISEAPPSTFLEAVQLVQLYALISGSNNYGRMDDYLGPFYTRDIKSGLIDDEKAVQILTSLWKLINDRKIIWDGRIVIGGRGRKHPEDADRLALVILETTSRVKDVLPQLTLRCFEGMDDAIFDKALAVLGEGNTYPMLYNDVVNISAAMKTFRVDEQTAKDCIPFGCGEYVIYHKSFGTPSGVINLLKTLEITLHHGIDPMTGKKFGTTEAAAISHDSFEDLYRAWSVNMEHYVYLLALQEKFEYEFAARTAPFLYLSLLFDSCINHGKPMFNGGIDHLGGTLETYGNTNTADSFLAIKKLVYDEKKINLNDLVKILDANFSGYEKIRKDCLDIPKYGNDQDEADEMMRRVHEDVCIMTMKMAEKVGLDSYLVVNINNNANTTLGRYTSASADGRLSQTSMANGNTPSPGMDRNGATALLNSLVKMRTDIHAGASQNIKFSREMLNRYLPMTKALIETYFKQGGAQLMFTVVGKEDLEMAMKNPADYPSLLVRVGGFSARFVELEKEVQMEILQRTLY